MAQRGKNNLRKDYTERRPERLRRYDQLFLIVCEDEKTEPAYFQQFIDLLPELPATTLFVRCIGTGLDPLGVINRTVEERDRLAEQADKEVDFVWAVFDKDDADVNPARTQRFMEALAKAEVEGIDLAFSNEVFELWLLLHLREVDPEILLPRAEVYAQLQAAVREAEASDFDYVHGQPEIIQKIAVLGHEEAAKQRAERLEAYHGDTPLLAANPSTRVHRLVVLLREWVVFYGWEG